MDNIWIPVGEEHDDAFNEATGEVFWDGYRPILCPQCRQATLRYFWRHYRTRTYQNGAKRRLGASWTWCPNCHRFYSADGGLPTWWPEQDPIPDVKDLGPSGVAFDSYWEQILQAISSVSHQHDQQSSSVSPESDEITFPTPTKRILYQLLFDALVDIRMMGYESNNKVVVMLAHLLHTVPLQLDRLDRGEIVVQDIMFELDERAQRQGIERWLHRRLGEIAERHPEMLAPNDTTP